MNKKEVNELRKRLAPDKNAITHIHGRYINGEKQTISEFCIPVSNMEKEELHKYMKLFKDSLSGSLGNKLRDLPFNNKSKREEQCQKRLLQLKDSHLEDEDSLKELFDTIAENYDHSGNYVILITSDYYDVPAKATDGALLEDSSGVYEYILCTICPVVLSKPGLSYFSEKEQFKQRILDWVVAAPADAFLFPAFNNRSADIHSCLYYSKKPDEEQNDFMSALFGCENKNQTFDSKKLKDALSNESLSFDQVVRVNEAIYEAIENNKLQTDEELKLSESDLKDKLSFIIEEDQVNRITSNLSENSVYANTLVNEKKVVLKDSKVTINIKPEDMDKIEVKEIDGQKYIVISADNNIEINGVMAAL